MANTYDFSFGEDTVYAAVRDLLDGLGRTGTVLDLGCGYGALAETVAARGLTYIGVDLDGGDPKGPDGAVDGGRAAILHETRMVWEDGSITRKPLDHDTSAGDNAAMESFFALLQNNVLDRQRWQTREQLRLAIITWIERTYHRRRRQRRLGRLTPIEYETINQAAHAA